MCTERKLILAWTNYPSTKRTYRLRYSYENEQHICCGNTSEGPNDPARIIRQDVIKNATRGKHLPDQFLGIVSMK